MACCEQSCSPAPKPDSRFRKALWIALVLNAVMFGVELAGGVSADSKSLLADAVDFLGDAANYAISLSVLAMGALWRARAALIKGVSMGLYGVGVLVMVLYGLSQGSVPEPVTMGVIGAMVRNCMNLIIQLHDTCSASCIRLELSKVSDSPREYCSTLEAMHIPGTDR